MKITFIQPYYKNIWEALGVGYIISHLKKYHPEHEYDFYQCKFDDDIDIVENETDADIVAFSCTSPAYSHGIDLAKRIKALSNKKVHIVFGGWHPTALPNDVVKEECVDQVIVGEGEHAMRLVVEGNREPIVYGSIMNNDLIEWPERNIIKNERTIDLCENINGQRTASFQMNRGCKVHCAFCAERLMSGKGIRTRNDFDVIEEIKAVRDEYNIDYFKFVDATFDVTPGQVIDFCRRKIITGLKLEWECNIHPGFVQHKEVFEWLKKANCNQINVGCESGSQKVLKGVGKGTNLQQIKNVFKWAKEYGIKRRGYFLLGMPNEDFDDLVKTEELIDEIEPDVVGFTILCPYPGSDFYVPELHRDVDWSKTDEYGNDFWRNNEYDNAGLKRIQAYFLRKYSHLLCERQEDK
jgi:radical SAM superfamily enzyme YgiQ (UPF0313 family)